MDTEDTKALTTLIEGAEGGIDSLRDGLRYIARRQDIPPEERKAVTHLIENLENLKTLILGCSVVLLANCEERQGEAPPTVVADGTTTFSTSQIISIHDTTDHKTDSGGTNHDTPQH